MSSCGDELPELSLFLDDVYGTTPQTAATGALNYSNRYQQLHVSSPAPSSSMASSSAYAFATISPGRGASASFTPEGGGDDDDDDPMERALLERRRKQRDLKRKSRARKKVRCPSCASRQICMDLHGW